MFVKTEESNLKILRKTRRCTRRHAETFTRNKNLLEWHQKNGMTTHNCRLASLVRRSVLDPKKQKNRSAYITFSARSHKNIALQILHIVLLIYGVATGSGGGVPFVRRVGAVIQTVTREVAPPAPVES